MTWSSWQLLDVKKPYQKVVAAELLIVANRKPTAQFLSLKHVTGKKVTNVKLRRFVRLSRNETHIRSCGQKDLLIGVQNSSGWATVRKGRWASNFLHNLRLVERQMDYPPGGFHVQLQ